MIKAVVFDLDDTLISEKEYIKSGFREVSRKVSNDFKLDINKVYQIIYSEFEKDAKNVFNRSLDILDIKYDKEYILYLIKEYRNHKPTIKLYEDAKYTIQALFDKGLKLGIITDGYTVTQRNKLEALDINHYFDEIIVTDELGREYWKPHKKPYEFMKDKLNLQYHEMIYIGDNISKDFITANELGINTIMINREDGIYSNLTYDKEYHAKEVINNLKYIFDAIDNLGEELNEENIICNYS